MNVTTEISDELNVLQQHFPEWSVIEGKLSAEYTFDGFRQACAFLTMVAIESEVLNHHPTYTHAFKRVNITLCTHSVGNKLTNLDVRLAQYIGRAAQMLRRL